MAFSQQAADDWGLLSYEERVRACLAVVADGTTANVDEIRGLEDADIRQIEEDQPAPLPDAYRCFLRHAGAGAGRFLQGSDVFHPDVLGVRAEAEELTDLRDTDRVILMHQGCQFDFLRGGGPDPEVWSVSEGGFPERHYACFTDWLKANAEEQTKAWQHLVPWCEIRR
jgi:hypothetical protein